ncbi:MAG: hypothetical protein LJE57_08050 [Gallionella sp.]|nr:hypothetical protein [Gallionella sp.]
MSWNFDKPLRTMCDSATNEADKVLWEKEDLGGITEDNNRLPVPIVLLVILTVITAFAVTFPLWGQRPTAEIYEGYIKAMSNPEVLAAKNDQEAMEKIIQLNKGKGHDGMLERHPVTMDDLRIMKPEMEALMAKGVHMDEYEVVGDHVVMANFEGNKRADGTVIRKQPWWDKGYLIDIFYLSYFFIGVTILIKRLPPSSWQPRHNH